MPTKKLVVVSNCQGGTLFNRFVGRASAEFAARYQWTATLQVHLLGEQDADRVARKLQEADVIVAQPVHRNPVPAVTVPEISALAARSGKQLVWFPALHFDCLLPGSVPSAWHGKRQGYPYGANEDLVLASAFVLGLPPAEAVELFHRVPLLGKPALQELVEKNIGEFVWREREMPGVVPMSGFYREQWARQRLHYVKSHPTGAVYRDLMQRIAPALDLGDIDPARVATEVGNNQFAMPLKRWVKESLGLAYADAEDLAFLEGEEMPFVQLVEKLWAFYAVAGRDEVMATLGLAQHPVHARVRDALNVPAQASVAGRLSSIMRRILARE